MRLVKLERERGENEMLDDGGEFHGASLCREVNIDVNEGGRALMIIHYHSCSYIGSSSHIVMVWRGCARIWHRDD